MSRATTQERLAVKTPEAAFLHVLQEEFHFSPRVSRELLSTAKEMLVGGIPSSAVRHGQARLVVASMKAPFGPSLADTEKVEVTLTVDAGAEDAEVKRAEKAEGLRRGHGSCGCEVLEQQKRPGQIDPAFCVTILCSLRAPGCPVAQPGSCQTSRQKSESSKFENFEPFG